MNRAKDEWDDPGLQSSGSRLAAAGIVALGLGWRLWLAHATFFNTDEAWHFAVANQDTLVAAYKASLTLAHPPLLEFILYFWRHLGTSDLMLRLPGVLAGTVFCWMFFKWLGLLFGTTTAWAGLIFATFLPPMIALSAELRQYSWMLLFSVCAAYWLERALAENSARMAVLSSLCLWLAMLSHYSAFLFAAALGIYAIGRILSQRPSRAVVACWGTGQAAGVGLAWFLYATHISKLSSVYPVAQPLQRFGDFYLSDWYFHPGRDHLLHFLYRGTFGVFRFIFGQTAIGQIATVLFLAGVILLATRSSFRTTARKAAPLERWTAVLLIAPFAVNWIAVVFGLYPYGRTRQCIFLAMVALAGVSLALGRVARNRVVIAAALAVAMVAACHAFGTLQGRDMLPLAEQRHRHMDEAVQFLRTHVSASDVMLTDKATSFQLAHYLCRQQPVNFEHSASGLDSFHCDGLRIVSTGPNDGALNAENLLPQVQQAKHGFNMNGDGSIWVVQGGWASGLSATVREKFPDLSGIEAHSFGRYLEVFKLPAQAAAGEGSVTSTEDGEDKFSPTGRRTTTSVPVLLESMSSDPPNWRSLSRIPRIPTPGVPSEDISSCLSDGMPLPLSAISTRTSRSR